jgi:hypothetical protein
MSKVSKRLAEERRDGDFLDRLEVLRHGYENLLCGAREFTLGRARRPTLPKGKPTHTSTPTCAPMILGARFNQKSTKPRSSFEHARESKGTDARNSS